jgi:hypothetical protein
MSEAVARVLELFRQESRRGVTGVTYVTGRQVTPKSSMVTPVTYQNVSPSEGSVTEQGNVVFGAYDVDERAAIAIYDGGIPEVYAVAFARLQIAQPIGVHHQQWLRAIDDAGRFLDQWGTEAERLQWSPDDLFKIPAAPRTIQALSYNYTAGLCWLLDGAVVDALDVATARLGDGRTFFRFDAKLGSEKRSEET